MRAPIVVACSLFFSCAFSQVSIGHRFGLASTRWIADGSNKEYTELYNSSQHDLLGVALEIPLDVRVLRYGRISTGLAFIQKGTSYESKGNFYRHNYLQIPFYLGPEFNYHRFAVSPQIGVGYGEYVRGEYHYNYDDQTPQGVLLLGRADDTGYLLTSPTHEWSLLGRLNLTYHVQRSRLELSLGYQHGLNNVMYGNVEFVDPNGNVAEPLTARQRSFVVQIGYSLELFCRIQKTTTFPVDSASRNAEVPEEEPRVRIGQRFGGTTSSIAFNGSLREENTRINDGAERLLATATAVVVSIRLGERLFFQPELAYSQKGWRCQWYPRPTTGNDLLRMNYAELPLLAKYLFGKAKLRPFAIVGPTVSMGVGGVDRYGLAGTWNGGFYEALPVVFGAQEGTTKYELFDLSGVVGGGLAFRSGEGELFIDVRYQHSFTDFYPERNHFLYSESAEAYHRNWILSVGYLVPWRK
ncbi:MAG: porin family protein [Flavobacteriales bacterium]